MLHGLCHGGAATVARVLPLFLSRDLLFLIFEVSSSGVPEKSNEEKRRVGESERASERASERKKERKRAEERGKQGGDLFIMRLRLCRGPAGEGSKCHVYFI